MFITYLLAGILFFIVLFIGINIENIYHILLENKIREHVAWCVVKDTGFFTGHNLPLITYLNRNTCSPYYITTKEEKIYSDIISMYQSNLIFKFFTKQLSTKRECRKMTGEEYFFMTLNNFLAERELETDFYRNEMYTYVSTIEKGTQKYTLTEYGIVFNKMFYSTLLYWARKDKNQNMFRSAEHIRNRIDKCEITISHF